MLSVQTPAAVQFALSDETRKWLLPLPSMPTDFDPPTIPQQIGPDLDRICVRAHYPGIYLEVILAADRSEPSRFRITSVWGSVEISREFARGPSTEGFVSAAVRQRFPELPSEARIWGGAAGIGVFNFYLDEAGKPVPVPPRPTTLTTRMGLNFPIEWAIRTLTVRIPEDRFPDDGFQLVDPRHLRLNLLRAELVRMDHRGSKILVSSDGGYKNGYVDLSTGLLERDGDLDELL